MNDENINKDEYLLVQKCIKGNQLAQNELFNKYYRLMLGICLRYANDREEAKEILQEGFIKVFRSIESFKFEGNLISWIKRIIINTAIDKYRKLTTQPVSVTLEPTSSIDYDENIIDKLNADDLLACINQLPLGYRTVFNLFVIEGYSHKEIGEKLNISEGTSKSQLFKAKQLLQEMISKFK